MAIVKVKARPVLTHKAPIVKTVPVKSGNSQRVVSETIKNKTLAYKVVYVAGYIAATPLIAFNKCASGMRIAATKASQILSQAASKTASFVHKAVSIPFNWVHANVYAPIATRVARLVNWTDNSLISPAAIRVQTTFKKNLAPVGKLPEKASNWTDAKIVQPVVNAIKKIASLINTNLVQPVKTAAVRAANWTLNCVTPAVQLIQSSFKAVFVSFPTFLYTKTITHVVRPIVSMNVNVFNAIYERALLPVARFVQNHVVSPALRGINMVTNALFVELPMKIKNGTLFAAKKLYDAILSPIGKTVDRVCKATFTPVVSSFKFIVTKLQEKVLSPVVRTVSAVASKTWQSLRTYVIQPTVAFSQTVTNKIGAVIDNSISTLKQLVTKVTGTFEAGFGSAAYSN